MAAPRRRSKARHLPTWPFLPRPGTTRVLVAAALLVLAGGLLGMHRCSPQNGLVSEVGFELSQRSYLTFATEVPLRPGSILHVLNHLERAERMNGFDVPAGSIPDDAWDPVFDKMWRLRDTADFDLLYLLNLLYAHGGHPAASPALWEKAGQAVRDFKYWYSDPTPARLVDGEPVVDSMWYWSENHVLLFRVNEYLAGQLYPDQVFSVTGMTGQEHMDRARGHILRWIEERSRWGFTEWHSDVYYNKDLTPLLSLVEWADDETLATRAEMLLDLVFLDIALHLHEGHFTATSGRSYVKDKAAAETQDVFHVAKMFFWDTDLPYRSRAASDASIFARAKNYRLPEVIRRIARDDTPMLGRQRMNLPIPEVPPADPTEPPPPAPYGMDWEDEQYLPYWWSTGAQPAWPLLRLLFTVAERENLWDSQLADAKPLRDLVWVDGDMDATVEAARELDQSLWPVLNESVLKEVNTTIYRTADYALSTAQDYRKGLRGAQTHTWQATLDEHAMVFTQHPGKLPVPLGDPVPPDWDWQQEDEPGPGYWTGEGSQPRAAQHENVAVVLYDPQYDPVPFFGFDYRDETHAYFPVAHFDEVQQQGGWTFGRKDEGYVALYSELPTTWRRGQPEVYQNGGQDFDLVAEGSATNAWIVEMGSADEWGSFAAFRDAVLAAEVDVDLGAMTARYVSPSQGEVTFGWTGPLQVGGQTIPIAGYPRFDNPYVQSAFDDPRYEIQKGPFSLTLDFTQDLREPSGPGAPSP